MVAGKPVRSNFSQEFYLAAEQFIYNHVSKLEIYFNLSCFDFYVIQKNMFSPLILSFSRVGTIVIISILPSTVVSIMYYRLFCCSTVPYNNTERVSFVTSWTEQVNVTTVTTVRDDPCQFIFRPWLCKHNITDTRLVSY